MMRAAGVFAHQPKMPHRNEQRDCRSVDVRDRSLRLVAHKKVLPLLQRISIRLRKRLAQQLTPRKDGQVIGEKARPTIVEVEEAGGRWTIFWPPYEVIA